MNEQRRVIEAGETRAQVIHHGVRENIQTSVTQAGILVELGDEQRTRVVHQQPPVGAFLNPAAAAQQAAQTAAQVTQAPTTADRLREAKKRHSGLMARSAAIKVEGKELSETIRKLEQAHAREVDDRDELAAIRAEREELDAKRSELDALAAQVVDQDELEAERAELARERKEFEAQKKSLEALQDGAQGQNAGAGGAGARQNQTGDKLPKPPGSGKGSKPGK